VNIVFTQWLILGFRWWLSFIQSNEDERDIVFAAVVEGLANEIFAKVFECAIAVQEVFETAMIDRIV
jgi:hypothetical protein